VPVLPLGAFGRGMDAARRGFDRAGLARAFGEDPALRRALAPFGRQAGLGAPLGRSDFGRGGLVGQDFGGRSSFGGKNMAGVFGQDDLFGQDGLFGDVRWDPATGLRVKGGGGPNTSGGAASGGAYGDPGSVGVAGGAWAALDAHNAEIMSAAGKYGVPANLIKSMINRESSGNWDANNYTNCSVRPGKCMLPFVGIFDETASSWGLDFQAMQGNKQAQIDGMAYILSQLAGQYGGYENAALVYFGGPAALTPGGFTDEYKMHSSEYGQKAIDGWKQLDSLGGAYGGGPGAGYGGSSSGGGWSSSLWGNAAAGVSYEFNAPSVNGDMYNYGSAHGTNGWSHPGVDVSLPWGTTLYTPKSGTVSCVGSASANVGGTGGGSCGYFCASHGNSCDAAAGPGNVTVKFDDGTFLVYGHSSAALVQPGQRVSAGQAVARSGGLQGDHVHLEYRVPGGCASGYCVADPRSMGGGNWQTGYAGGGTTQTSGGQSIGGVQSGNGQPYSPGYQIPSRLSR
jgi:murein DD-endopeptidase MepM/ murein hydrolase activator NlpD